MRLAMAMHDLVIIGAGGHGRETLDIVEAINAAAAPKPLWRFMGFVDDGPVVQDRLDRRNVTVAGTTDWLEANHTTYVIGIGAPEVRAQLDQRLTHAGIAAATLVHPMASVGSDNSTGHGVLLAAGARVTTNVTLTGTAEAISDGRWWVGVSGLTSDECVVLRMTAERRGDGLVGWATLDRAGRANSLSFVAVPIASERVPDAG